MTATACPDGVRWCQMHDDCGPSNKTLSDSELGKGAPVPLGSIECVNVAELARERNQVSST
jgi:hypothetical protein